MDEMISDSRHNVATKKGRDSSKTAETLAMVRASESKRLEDERICYDPFAIHFVSRAVLEFAARNPEKFKAFVAENERLVPGAGNSCVARVRYIDDVVKSSLAEGLEQLVIFGAGYDTRAYRIDELKKVRVFEVDHPVTQRSKVEKVREIFGSLSDNVTYVPVDLEVDDPGLRLVDNGYDRARKTLFVMEGLLMYLSPAIVDEILSFIVHNSRKGSAIIFDYIPRSVIDGTCELEAGKNWQKGVTDVGEPFLFGIEPGTLEAFLVRRGFTKARNMTSEDYKKAYFRGKNADRTVNSLLSFAYAVVE